MHYPLLRLSYEYFQLPRKSLRKFFFQQFSFQLKILLEKYANVITSFENVYCMVIYIFSIQYLKMTLKPGWPQTWKIWKTWKTQGI